DRYGVKDPKMRRFRYGVQVNSLGLTEAQPENNVQRIVLEALGVTLSKGARARSLQLPAWNEALGLPKPWDQQWSLRMQQVLAHETDLLEYEDIFDGSKVIEGLTSKLIAEAQTELDDVMSLGGAFVAINELKGRLVASHTERMRKIEEGTLTVVGVNQFIESAESPLTSEESILRVDPAVETEIRADLADWKLKRDDIEVKAALNELRLAASSGTNIMLSTIAAAKVGVTTGEWSQVLRDVFGEYRAPTGVSSARRGSNTLADVAQLISGLQQGPPRLLVAKPGLDGHSNGAEQIAVAARDAGMEVIYDGIRVTPEHIAAAARDEDVDIIGLSILSGSHLHLIPEVLEALRKQGVTAPVVVGGIIPLEDQGALIKAGVSRIYTPKDYELAQIMTDIAQLVIEAREISA
ncbi:MAG: methylmalonyl-CoA mutase family protein, partial [Actinomycetota bacterium]|nr:methylmalonyl-CoA mutase family protein [Actinomycetota bacterium]